MGDSNFFKGTSTDQDRRFADKESKLLKSLKFPPEFEQKVDMRKVKLEVLKPWITTRFTELNGFEDDIVSSMIIGLLEEKDNLTPDPRKIQIQVQGFLTTKAPQFMLELWKLLLDAQSNPHGIPQSMIDEQKEKFMKGGSGASTIPNSRFDQGPSNNGREFSGRGFDDRGRGRGRGRGGGERGRGRGGFRGRGRYDEGPRRGFSPRRRSYSPGTRRRGAKSRSRSPRRYRSPSPRRRSRSRTRSRSPYRGSGGGRRKSFSRDRDDASSVRSSRAGSPPRRNYGRRRSISRSRSPARRRRRSRSDSKSSMEVDRKSPKKRKRSASRDKSASPRRRSHSRSKSRSRSASPPRRRKRSLSNTPPMRKGAKSRSRSASSTKSSRDGKGSMDLDDGKVNLNRLENEAREKALKAKMRSRQSGN